MNSKDTIIKKRIEKNTLLREEMTKKGYQEKQCIIENKKAQLLGFLIMLPFVALSILLYSLRWSGNPNAFDIGYSTLIIFILGLVIYTVVHEIIHGITWSIFCINKIKSIEWGFFKEIFTPYAYCEEVLSFSAFSLGTMMPCVLLGLGTCIVSFIIPSLTILLLGLLAIIISGGDFLIFIDAIKNRNALILCHPTEAGIIIFIKATG